MDREGATRVPNRAQAGFSARLAKRQELWWGKPFRWGHVHGYRDALHRTRERFALRSRSEPDAAWQCCPQWPRTLVNKWNSREFCAEARLPGARALLARTLGSPRFPTRRFPRDT